MKEKKANPKSKSQRRSEGMWQQHEAQEEEEDEVPNNKCVKCKVCVCLMYVCVCICVCACSVCYFRCCCVFRYSNHKIKNKHIKSYC